MSDPGIILHGTELSGHTHRVELLLRMLGLPYRTQTAPAAVRGSPEFQKLNPLRQIPVLQDGDLTLADSNAILVYLAKRYAPGGQWLPEAPVAAAQVQRWLSIAAGRARARGRHSTGRVRVGAFLAATCGGIAEVQAHPAIAPTGAGVRRPWKALDSTPTS